MRPIVNYIVLVFKIIWASPYSLLGLLLGCVCLLFGGHVQRMGRTLEFNGNAIAWLIDRFPHGEFTLAFTLGHIILARSETALDITREHERVHVAQYERWGPFTLPAYYAISAYLWLAGKNPYRDNPFERAANRDEQ